MKKTLWLLVAVLAAGLIAAAVSYPKVGGLVFAAGISLENKLYGLEAHQQDIGELSIPYYRGGTEGGQAIVMVHGYTADKTVWPRFARFFVDSYDVIIPDLAGHGDAAFDPTWDYSQQAQAERIVALMDKLDIERIHIIGNSMGGYIAAYFALAFPERTLSATMIGSTFLQPGAASPTCRPVVFSRGTSVGGPDWDEASLDKGHLLLVAQDALGHEDHQQHQAHADEDEPHHSCLVGGHEGQHAGVDEGRHQVAEEELQHPEDHRAEHRTEHRRRTAQQHDRVDEEGQRGDVDAGAGVGAQGVDDAAGGDDHATDDQGLHLVGEDVLAQGAHRVLVLADAAQDAAPRAAHHGPDQQDGERQQDDADDDRPQLVLVELPRAEAVLPVGDRVRRLEVTGVAVQAVGGAGDLLEGHGEQQQAQHLGRGDGDDREVVTAQSQGGVSQNQPGQRRDRHGDRRGGRSDLLGYLLVRQPDPRRPELLPADAVLACLRTLQTVSLVIAAELRKH